MTANVNPKIKDDLIDQLFKAILLLESIEECYAFFEDVCTVNEIKSLAQRLEVAKMLQRKSKYTDITEQTGASAATISRVNRALSYGTDGYTNILERLREDEKGTVK
ncbi:MAG TPA: hypothetical protein GX707_10970 [Epulopiscium sp.]|nr:hypothetical protein [Candidatus Epulonipiscium sp.]